ELPPLLLQYKDFSQWQNSGKEKENLKRQQLYWLKEFQGEIPVLNLPTDYARPAVQSYEGNTLYFELDEEKTAALNKMALEEGATLYIVLMALFNILLSKISNMEDIVIGTPTAGRRHADLEPIIGMFVNTLAMRNYPLGENRFIDFLHSVKERTLEAFENQDYQFEDLVEKVSVSRDLGRNPVFDVLFALQNMEPGDPSQQPDLPVPAAMENPAEQNPPAGENRTSKFDLVLNGSESKKGLRFSLGYATKLFKRDTIERFITYFKAIHTTVLANPAVKLSEIEIVSSEEKRRILHDFNDSKVPYPQQNTLHRIFENQVAGVPDNIAVVAAPHNTGKTHHSDTASLGYRELNEKATALSLLLREKGLLHNRIVALVTERSPEMIIGIFAILKAGGAYMPVDPDAPILRTRFMLRDSGARILLTQSHLRDKFSGLSPSIPGQNIICIDEPAGCPGNISQPSPTTLAADPAYVIYTSGTTGTPKGVVVNHQNVVNLVWGLKQAVYKNYRECLNISLAAPYVFDASVKQIFAALLQGHCLHVVPESIRLNGILLLRYYEKNKINISDGTPTHIRILLESIDESMPVGFSSLRHLIIGGEALPASIMARFFALLGQNAPAVTNIYGPTECTVDSTYHEVTPGNVQASRIIPIGTPMPNYQVYIVNKGNRLQPPGITGEICIGGCGVARGYLNNPELTAKKFKKAVINQETFAIGPSNQSNQIFPNDKNPNTENRLYFTGDLARRLPDGNIEFLGRIDHQVKIRGFRIELGEIENQLLKSPLIEEAVVQVRNDKKAENPDLAGSDNFLCAYIVPRSTSPDAPSQPGQAKLKEYLSRSLPGYMIPSYFIEVEKIPLTPSGKIDGKALAELHVSNVQAEYTAPRDESEEKLARLFSEVLSMEEKKISIHADFFELG
ncbi:MAG: amino acid adenylation domain-containing protein, partial [bacterium]|nr:amino acid adenylation domain-containing protein [bacterium]